MQITCARVAWMNTQCMMFAIRVAKQSIYRKTHSIATIATTLDGKTMGTYKKEKSSVVENLHYYTSHGYQLPDHWKHHLPGQHEEEACVFCDNAHYESHFLMIAQEHFSTECSLPVGVCGHCWKELEKTLGAAWTAEQEDAAVGYPEDFHSIIHEVLLPYVTKGIIPPSQNKMGENAYEGFHVCDFCETEIVEINRFYPYNTQSERSELENGLLYMSIFRPIIENDQKVIAPAVCCNRCDGAIAEFISLMQIVPATDEELLMEKCYTCIASYPISRKEKQAREMSAPYFNLEKYLCPLCVRESWGKKRCPTIECTKCGKVRVIDLYHVTAYDGSVDFDSCDCEKENMDNMIRASTIRIPKDDGTVHLFELSYQPLMCGRDQRMHYVIKDTQVPTGEDNILLSVGTNRRYCSKGDQLSCGCSSTEQDDINEHITNMTYLLIEYVDKKEEENDSG